jgi:peptidoglycan/LPS O-acetylase OafA/YrhL
MFMRGLSAASRLSDFRGRDNNFNLLRIVAATLVVAAHAASPGGGPSVDPTQRLFGIGAGDLGVDIFFVLSGFLVTKSFAGKPLAEFAWARVMRIYPGLWTSTVLTVVVAGLFFADIPPQQFFASRDTITYFAHNLTMLPSFGSQSSLPHVFALPDDKFNLPLWTLPHELQMYMLLAAVGTLAGLRARYIGALALFGALCVILAKLGGMHLLTIDRGRFIYFFFTGSLAYVFRQRILLTGWIAMPLLCVVVGSVFATGSMLIREAALALALPYLLLWCAYVPAGFLRLWNRLGDYSYGIYIYGFPVQAALATTGRTGTALSNFVWTMLLVTPIAVASWHLLEQRALRIPFPWARAPKKSAAAAPDAVGS